MSATVRAAPTTHSLWSDLRALGSWTFLRGVVRRFEVHNGADVAAALAYYVLFSLFPAILVVASAVDLVWSPTAFFDMAEPLLSSLPAEAHATLRGFIADALQGKGGGFLGAGMLGLLWAGSGWFRALARAIETIAGVSNPRGFLRNAGFALRMLAVTVLGAFGLIATLVGPELLRPIVDLGVLDDLLVQAWAWIRWPALLVLLTLSTSLLYTSTSKQRQRGRWFTVGSIVAVASWVLMTVGLKLYFAYAARTSWMYGALSGVIALLLWAWLFNLAALIGALVNAELAALREGAVAKSPVATGGSSP